MYDKYSERYTQFSFLHKNICVIVGVGVGVACVWMYISMLFFACTFGDSSFMSGIFLDCCSSYI